MVRVHQDSISQTPSIIVESFSVQLFGEKVIFLRYSTIFLKLFQYQDICEYDKRRLSFSVKFFV